MDSMAPAETLTMTLPRRANRRRQTQLLVPPLLPSRSPTPYVPRRLVEVAGKRVPIPLKRPKKG